MRRDEIVVGGTYDLETGRPVKVLSMPPLDDQGIYVDVRYEAVPATEIVYVVEIAAFARWAIRRVDTP